MSDEQAPQVALPANILSLVQARNEGLLAINELARRRPLDLVELFARTDMLLRAEELLIAAPLLPPGTIRRLEEIHTSNVAIRDKIAAAMRRLAEADQSWVV